MWGYPKNESERKYSFEHGAQLLLSPGLDLACFSSLFNAFQDSRKNIVCQSKMEF